MLPNRRFHGRQFARIPKPEIVARRHPFSGTPDPALLPAHTEPWRHRPGGQRSRRIWAITGPACASKGGTTSTSAAFAARMGPRAGAWRRRLRFATRPGHSRARSRCSLAPHDRKRAEESRLLAEAIYE